MKKDEQEFVICKMAAEEVVYFYIIDKHGAAFSTSLSVAIRFNDRFKANDVNKLLELNGSVLKIG